MEAVALGFDFSYYIWILNLKLDLDKIEKKSPFSEFSNLLKREYLHLVVKVEQYRARF